MKKLSILFIVLSIILTSCSSDDSPKNISGDILGIWIATDLTIDGTISTEFQGQSLNGTFDGKSNNMTNTLTFNESPNTLVSEGSFDMTITYNINGIIDTENIADNTFIETGIWEQNGNKLSITNEDETGVIEIFELTNTKLVLGLIENEIETESGISSESRIETIATYRRQ